MTAPEPGIERLPGGKIRISFSLAQPGVTADGMRVIGRDDPRYADWDEWLAVRDAPGEQDTWTVEGEIPDTGSQVTLTWRDGIDGWPPDALDWLLAAATAGVVQADDGPGLHAWLLSQQFRDALRPARPLLPLRCLAGRPADGAALVVGGRVTVRVPVALPLVQPVRLVPLAALAGHAVPPFGQPPAQPVAQTDGVRAAQQHGPGIADRAVEDRQQHLVRYRRGVAALDLQDVAAVCAV